MGSIGCECCEEGCPTPPDIEIDGTTVYQDWVQVESILGSPPGPPLQCCFRRVLHYITTPSPATFYSPVIAEKNFEYKFRSTYRARMGTITGYTCVLDSDISDVAYAERWMFQEDAWRKFATVNYNIELIMYATLVVVTEGSEEVPYWYFRIQESFSGQYGWQRKRRVFDDQLRVPLSSCVFFRNGNIDLNKTSYSTFPAVPSWVDEPGFTSYFEGSQVYGRVRVEDLESLPPLSWWEMEVSSSDSNLVPPSGAGCVPGVQDPLNIPYSISPFPPCEEITQDNSDACIPIIRRGALEVIWNGRMVGTQGTNIIFGLTQLYVAAPCCIDESTFCRTFATSWLWDHETEILANECETLYDPMDMIVHSTYQVRIRL